jgi:hypothetical protein
VYWSGALLLMLFAQTTIPAIERQGRRAVNRTPLLLLVPRELFPLSRFARHFCGTPSTWPVWAKFRTRDTPDGGDFIVFTFDDHLSKVAPGTFLFCLF